MTKRGLIRGEIVRRPRLLEGELQEERSKGEFEDALKVGLARVEHEGAIFRKLKWGHYFEITLAEDYGKLLGRVMHMTAGVFVAIGVG